MTTEKSRYFTPGRSYDFQLKIKGEDYSQDLSRVRIVSSLTASYQSVVLDIFVDPNDFSKKRLPDDREFAVWDYMYSGELADDWERVK